METNYTAGPWYVDPAESRAISGERIFKVIADSHYRGLIADVSAWWLDTKSAKANASLIAAAPDLLAAIEEHIMRPDYWDGLRAAVIKAKGEA